MARSTRGDISTGDLMDELLSLMNSDKARRKNTKTVKEHTKAVEDNIEAMLSDTNITKENTEAQESNSGARKKSEGEIKKQVDTKKKVNSESKKEAELIERETQLTKELLTTLKTQSAVVKSNGSILSKYKKDEIKSYEVLNGEVSSYSYNLKNLKKQIDELRNERITTDVSIKNRYGEDNGKTQNYDAAKQELFKLEESLKGVEEKYKKLLSAEEADFNELEKLDNEYANLQETLYSVKSNFEEQAKVLLNNKHSIEEVAQELQELYGINLNSMSVSTNGNVKTFTDEMGNVVKITEKLKNSGSKEYIYQLSSNMTGLTKKTQDLENKVNRLTKGLGNLKQTAETKKAEELRDKMDGLISTLKKLEKQIYDAERAGDKLKAVGLREEYAQTQAEAQKLGKELENTTAIIRNQGGWMLNLKDSWIKAMRSFTTYISVTTIFYQAIRAIRSMISEVKELDKALTEFKKVSDLAGKSLDRYVKKAGELGSTVAKTTSEMIAAATEFKKSGFGDQDSLELGKIANMYTNIADEELSAGEAASFIIAQLKAFKIEAKDAIRVVDALNEVSNNYAVSSADLAGAIGKVSATLAAGNTSYEETLGLLTAITEITRNADKAANALKTIGQRIRGVGEDGEDASEYIASLQQEFDKLGISIKIIKNSNGDMESTYNILKAMAENWERLTEAQRQSLGEIAAGKNRITELNALMSNWQTAVEATNTALESNGSAARENAKVLDSIEGHLQSLRAAWQRLSQSLVDSQFLKTIIDLGTGLVKLIDSTFGKLVVKTAALSGVVFGASAAFEKFNKFIKKNILEGSNLKNVIAYLTRGEKGLINSLYRNEKGYKDLTLAEKVNRVETEKLRITQLRTKIAIVAMSAAISVAVMAFQQMRDAEQELIEKNEELIDKEKELDNLINQSKNASESEKKEIFAQLLDLQKSLNKEYQLGITILENQDNSKLKEQLELTKRLVTEKKKERAQSYLNNKSGNFNFGTALMLSMTNLGDVYGRLLTGGFKGFYSRIGELTDEYNNELKNNIIEAVLTLNDDLSKLTEDFANGNYANQQEIEDAWYAFIAQYYNILGEMNLTPEQKEMLENYATSVLDNVKEVFALKLQEEKFDKVYDAYEKSIKEFIKRIQNNSGLDKQGIKDLFNIIEGNDGHIDLTKASEHSELARMFINVDSAAKAAGMTFDEFIDKINFIDGSVKKATDTFEELKKELDLLSSAFNEQYENGKLSAETIWNLVDSGYAAALSFDKETSAVRLDSAALDVLYKAKLQLKSIDLQDSINDTISLLESESTAVARTIDEWVALVQAKQKAGGKLTANEQSLLNLYGEKKAVDNLIISWNKLKKAGRTSSGSSSSGKSAWEKSLESLSNQYKNSQITIEQYITKLEALRKKYKKNKTAVKELDKTLREARLEKLEDDYKRGLISVDAYIKGLKELQKAYKEGTKEWNKYADSIKKGLETLLGDREGKFKDAQKAAVSILDEEINKIDALITAKQKENDETERQIELQKLQENLENARRNKNKRVFVTGLGWVYQRDEQAVEEAQKALDDFQSEQEIRDLEKQKELLESYRDSWQDITKSYEQEQNRLLLAEVLGADAEGQILNQRLEVLEDFRDKYIAVLRDLNMLDKTTADSISQDGITLESGGSYANGGVVDYTGYARVHGSVNKPEIVLSNSQAASLYSMLNRPQTSSLKVGSGSNTQIYNFDNLVLPNVSNARQFINELKSITNLTRNQ